MKIEIVQTAAGQPFHARIRGDNGEIVWITENYVRRSRAIEAVTLLAQGFGIKGAPVVEGPPGNAVLVFRQSQFMGTVGSELRFALVDVDERGDR